MVLALLVAATASGPARADQAKSLTESQAQPVYLLQPGAKATALPRVVLLFDPAVSTLRVPPPPQLELLQKGLMEKQATVTVNYLPAGPGSESDICIAWPEQARAAFTYAANLWASQLQSAVPITIDACWANNLGSGVLGHAGANNFLRDFPAAPVGNTWYPVALANALSGRDLDPDDSDLYAAFSSTFSWYFGTDGNTPSSQLDFVSVLLHEIGHGLGFSGSMQVSNGQGSWGVGSTFPFIYDRYTENGSGQSLINTALFANPSAALATQLQSNAVFFDAANANAANGGARAPLYAPSTWRSGSSYSHLAESFNNTPNALMTFSLASGESVHAPGPVTLGMFRDMGWPLSTSPGNLTLTVSKDGTGSGTVTSLPEGINCGATCSASFASGTTVTLTASATAGAAFVGWSGGGCSGTGTCTVTMNAATTIVATFNASAPTSFKLAVSVSGTGSGTVTSSPAGINCGSVCSAGFDSGTKVALDAAADAGSVFSGWSGACTDTGNCLVTMDAAKSVTATFRTAPTPLTSGQVVANLSAAVDEAQFFYIDVPAGATALTVQTFVGSGDVDLYVRRGIEPTTTLYDCRSSNTGTAENCFFSGPTAARHYILLNATGGYSGVSLQATYALAGVAHALTVSKAGSGRGVVTSSPSGINCGTACSGVFNAGTAVRLTAAASGGSTFGGWSGGGCSGTGTCTVTINAATTVAATFNAVPVIARLSNLSTRGQAQTGDNVMIGGFIVDGTAPKRVLITARGPSLTAFGVAGALANPMLHLFSGQTVIASNDDFGTASNAAEIRATGKAPTNALESAILTTLNPGAYTAIVSGVNGGTGVGIVEVFEIDRPDVPLTNLSTRGQVQTGDNVMIGGFVIEGTQPKTVLIRANGPSLAAFGVQGVLANPTLRLNSGQTVVASNDDWQSASNASAIQATGLAPTNPLESAILMTLNPGAYTAIVSGANGGTGVGIVEVFAK